MKFWISLVCAVAVLGISLSACAERPAPVVPTTSHQVSVATLITDSSPAPQPVAAAQPMWQPYSLTGNLSGVSLRYIISLGVSPENGLWVGSENDGAFFYDGSAWQQFTTADGLGDNSVHDFAFAPDGSVWVSTWFGISHFTWTSWKSYLFDKDLVGNDFHPLALDPDGSVWMGSGRALLHLKNEMWEVSTGEALRVTSIALWMDADGTLWFASDVSALMRLQGEEIATIGVPNFPEGTRINTLMRGPDGAFWLATSRGIYRYADEQWQTPDDGLLAGNVLCLAFTPEGALWAGTYGDGVYHYNGQNWAHYTTADGLVDNIVNAVAVMQDGVVWVGTTNGLGYLPVE